MRLGEAYTWHNAHGPDAVAFVVVAEATHWCSEKDRDGSEGFLVLILQGAHRDGTLEKWKYPGETFTFAKSSAMASDSRRWL